MLSETQKHNIRSQYRRGSSVEWIARKHGIQPHRVRKIVEGVKRG